MGHIQRSKKEDWKCAFKKESLISTFSVEMLFKLNI